MFNKDFEGINNVAGIKRLLILQVPVYDGLSRNALLNQKQSDTTTALKYEVFFEPKSCELNVTLGNSSTEVAVKCAVPMLTQELLTWLRKHKQLRWKLYFEDLNGLVYELGAATGMSMELSGGVNTSRNGYTLSWKRVSGEVFCAFSNIKLDNFMGVAAIDLREYVERDIYAVKGNSHTVDFSWQTVSGTNDSLVGNTFSMKVVNATGVQLIEFTLASGFSLIATNTKLLLTMTKVQTAAWAAGEYKYRLLRTWPDTTSKTVFKGKFIVEDEY